MLGTKITGDESSWGQNIRTKVPDPKFLATKYSVIIRERINFYFKFWQSTFCCLVICVLLYKQQSAMNFRTRTIKNCNGSSFKSYFALIGCPRSILVLPTYLMYQFQKSKFNEERYLKKLFRTFTPGTIFTAASMKKLMSTTMKNK